MIYLSMPNGTKRAERKYRNFTESVTRFSVGAQPIKREGGENVRMKGNSEIKNIYH